MIDDIYVDDSADDNAPYVFSLSSESMIDFVSCLILSTSNLDRDPTNCMVFEVASNVCCGADSNG